MNKQNKILLGILALIVACTIGYALFSETITINGTASASGSFNMVPSCTIGAPTGTIYDFSSEGGTSNDLCTVDAVNNSVTITTTLNYPSARKYFDIKIENQGTITATFNIDTAITESFSTTVYNWDDSVDEETTDDMVGVYLLDGIYLETDDGTKIALDDEDIIEYYDEDLTILSIPVGYSLHMVIGARWPNNVHDNSVYFVTTANYGFEFIQATN